MNHADLMSISKYPQYALFFIFMVLFVKKSPRTRMLSSEVMTYAFMLLLSVMSYMNGLSHGYEVNVKPIVLTLIFIFINSRILPVALFKKLIILLTILLLIEYVIAYTQIVEYIPLRRVGGLIRPMGIIFLDLHLLSYVLVFGYFVLGYTKLSGAFALVFGSYQTALAWLFLVYKKINKAVLFIFFICLCLVLYSVGHLVPGQTNSMISVVLGVLDLKLDYGCITWGCSVNVDSISRESISGSPESFGAADRVYDFGYYRLTYQFGAIWLLALIYALRKYSKVIILANIVLAVHYPVNLGILGIVFFVWILQYAYQLNLNNKYNLAPGIQAEEGKLT